MPIITGAPIIASNLVNAIQFEISVLGPDSALTTALSLAQTLQGQRFLASQGPAYIVGVICDDFKGQFIVDDINPLHPTVSKFTNSAGIIAGNRVRAPIVDHGFSSSAQDSDANAISDALSDLGSFLTSVQVTFPAAILYGYALVSSIHTELVAPFNHFAQGVGVIGLP